MIERWYSVYILTGESGVLYIGMTNNLKRRIGEHKQKKIEGFTKKYGLTKLVHFERYATATAAIAREKQLKGWARKRKIELIETGNPNWLDLASEWFEERLPEGELPKG